VARPPAYARSQERIVRLGETINESRALREQALAEIRRVVGFEAYAWVLTDPETSVGAAPLADVPAPVLPLLPRLIGLKYLTETNRWTTLDSAAVSLWTTTGGRLSRSRLWRELLAGHGVTDIASCVFRDRFGCWAFLDLWRIGTRFTEPEVAFLTRLVKAVTPRLRDCQATTFVARPARQRQAGPVVLLLSPQLRVLGQTPETHEYLRMLVPPPDQHPPIPASAYNVAAQLLALEAGIDHNPPLTRVHLSGGLWVNLRAARIGGTEPADGRNIAVTIEETPAAERAAIFARACGLTKRETELLNHLVTGTDTKEVAQRMFVSEHTVQDHLKSIFAKTATRNRRSLLSRALGT
jgi:DNA-binding CsgD family transcriptional regulator